MVKMNLIEEAAESYKKLPLEKKMFVLGIMQGIIIGHPEHQDNNEEFVILSRQRG